MVGVEASVAVRPAALADIPAVGAIERSSFTDPWGDSEFRSAIDSTATIFLVAEHSKTETICGYAIALTVLDESEILNIAVEPGSRGAGVGGKLLDAALRAVGDRGGHAVYLEVRESNESARRLYASRGFSELSRRKKYYRKPVEDALVLALAMQ
jgi:ribosomal-protein-alanine N-acetyltransferase